jgi:hypothetical protein
MPKSKHQVPGRVRATYEFIKANRNRWSVQALCRVLEVAPSGYYDWLLQPLSNRAQEDARLLRLIRASFIAPRWRVARWAMAVCYTERSPLSSDFSNARRRPSGP